MLLFFCFSSACVQFISFRQIFGGECGDWRSNNIRSRQCSLNIWICTKPSETSTSVPATAATKQSKHCPTNQPYPVLHLPQSKLRCFTNNWRTNICVRFMQYDWLRWEKITRLTNSVWIWMCKYFNPLWWQWKYHFNAKYVFTWCVSYFDPLPGLSSLFLHNNNLRVVIERWYTWLSLSLNKKNKKKCLFAICAVKVYCESKTVCIQI